MAEFATPPVDFETHPDRYVHWRLSFDGPVATLLMRVDEDRPMWPGRYELKLNSYDLGVDIELCDAVQRLRFEHPEIRAVVVTSGADRIFCAGANIRMLASSPHAFKVNFCKYTNETRTSIEDASANSGITWMCAINGTSSGGGYELAMACQEIGLIDDGSSAVALPEVPLLGVLPGTGGLTRLTDKRRVRRDLADVFCTKAEGFKARDALKWGFVDWTFPRSKWDEGVSARARTLAAAQPDRTGPGVPLPPLERTDPAECGSFSYKYVSVDLDGRVAVLTVRGPDEAPRRDAGTWALRAFRELDDALLRLRFNHLDTGLLLLRTEGDPAAVLAHDVAVAGGEATDWFWKEVRLFQARTLRRLDNTARSLFALVEPGHCFSGSLLEIAFSADRVYMLQDDGGTNAIRIGPANLGRFPMSNVRSRLDTRFAGRVDPASLPSGEALDAAHAEKLGLVTAAPDEIDWEDEIRIAVEERVSLSPDALTGMEQNLRFGGAETTESKIYGRLSAWQNWIFQRPNAVGERGALTLYGHPERPVFDYRRT